MSDFVFDILHDYLVTDELKSLIFKSPYLLQYKYIINIYGSYQSFIDDQNDSNGDLYIRNVIYELDNTEYEFTVKYYLLCKMGNIQFIKKYFSYVYNYFIDRNDLNIISRFFMSFKKANEHVYKTVFYIRDLGNYFFKKEEYDKKIKSLFDSGEIEEIYLYRYKEPKTIQKPT